VSGGVLHLVRSGFGDQRGELMKDIDHKNHMHVQPHYGRMQDKMLSSNGELK